MASFVKTEGNIPSPGVLDGYFRLAAAVVTQAIKDFLNGDFCTSFDAFIFLNHDAGDYTQVLGLESDISIVFNDPKRFKRNLYLINRREQKRHFDTGGKKNDRL